MLTNAAVPVIDYEDIAAFKDSWLLHLEAEGGRDAQGAAPSTLLNYPRTLEVFRDFMVEKGMPTNVHSITREHIETFIVHLRRTYLHSTTPRTYYYHLRSFFGFLVDTAEELTVNPMTNISPPPKPDKIRSVVEEANIVQMLKSCSSKTFRDVRDAALIRLMIDAGPRLGEATHLSKDVDLRGRRARVMGKRMQERDLVFGSKTALSLDHYLRARRRHAFADREELWLGLRGPLTESGVYQMLSKRAAKIGIHASPHQLRHSWAHLCKMQGMSDETLMVLGGWRSAEMLRYYGRSAAAERAALEHARLSPGDRF